MNNCVKLALLFWNTEEYYIPQDIRKIIIEKYIKLITTHALPIIGTTYNIFRICEGSCGIRFSS